MADPLLPTRPPLAALARAARHGRRDGPPGVTVEERAGLQIVTLAARQGQTAALAAAVRSAWALDLPTVPRRVGDALAFSWAGDARWSVWREDRGEDLEAMLRTRLGALATIVDESDSRIVLRIGGPRARCLLAKGIPIDLHPNVFQPGDTALTGLGRIGVQIWRTGNGLAYDLSAYRSLADSLCAWLAEAGAEYGIEMLAQS